MKENIFAVPDDIKKKLNIQTGQKETAQDRILQIFAEAERIGKTELSIAEVTAAYYNLYTAKRKDGIKDKKMITLLLCLLKGGKKDNGALASAGRGKFKIRKSKK